MKTTFLWGTTGSGKTLRAVQLAVTAFLLGRQIWGNIHLKHIPYTYYDIPELIDIVTHKNVSSTPKTMIMDEIQTAFDGRSSGSAQNRALSLFVSQCRKRGFDIIYTSQYITGADSRLRVLTDKLVRCEAIVDRNDFGLGTFQDPEPVKFIYKTVDPKDPLSRVKKKTIYRDTARFFHQFYNTYEVVRPQSEYIGGEYV